MKKNWEWLSQRANLPNAWISPFWDAQIYHFPLIYIPLSFLSKIIVPISSFLLITYTKPILLLLSQKNNISCYLPNYEHHLEPCLSLPNCLWSYYFHPFSSMHLWVSTSMHRSTFHFFHFYFNDNFLITYNPCNRQHFLFLLL